MVRLRLRVLQPLWVGDEEDVTDGEVATPWFRLPREATTAVAHCINGDRPPELEEAVADAVG